MTSLSSYSPMIENVSFFHIQSILTFCWSSIATTLIITLGLFTGTQLSGYYEYNLIHRVNRSSCTCDCWDGFFRGLVPRGGYKTFYINYEIHAIILIGLLLFYAELLRYFLVKLIINKRLITLLLIPAIYSNFYGTWNLINYINDHNYHLMLPSQLFFSITELIVNYIFYQGLIMSKTDKSIPRWSAYLVATVCSVHILLAVNELDFELMRRNILLLIPDFISLVWVGNRMIRDHNLRPDKRYACIWFFIGLCILLFYYTVCPYRDQ